MKNLTKSFSFHKIINLITFNFHKILFLPIFSLEALILGTNKEYNNYSKYLFCTKDLSGLKDL